MKIIVSIISIVSSSNPFVEIEILADSEFAGITICVAVTVVPVFTTLYSSISVAVPERTKGTVTSYEVTLDKVAVSSTSVAEFSTMDSDENSKLTSGAGSLSSIKTVIASKALASALAGCNTFIDIVSVGSKEASSIVLIVKLPRRDPEGIFIVPVK